MLVPDVPLLEIFVRGTLVYLGTFAMLRVIVKREFGAMSISDLIVIVFIADAAQNAMAGEYTSITDGIVLVATLIFWAFALDFLSYRFRWFERIVKPHPLPIIENGKLNRRNMRREFVTDEELNAQLRAHGVEDAGQVERAFLESDGTFTVVPSEGAEESPAKKRRLRT